MKKIILGFLSLILLFGLGAYFLDNEAGATDPVSVKITRAFVTNLSYGNKAYKGDTIEFVDCFDVSGGISNQQYVAKVVVLPDYGNDCAAKKKKIIYKTEPGVVVGPDSYIVTLPNKVPRCADDMTYGVSIAGVPYTMKGNWVDVTFRVQLFDMNGFKLAKDAQFQEQIFLVTKRP